MQALTSHLGCDGICATDALALAVVALFGVTAALLLGALGPSVFAGITLSIAALFGAAVVLLLSAAFGSSCFANAALSVTAMFEPSDFAGATGWGADATTFVFGIGGIRGDCQSNPNTTLLTTTIRTTKT